MAPKRRVSPYRIRYERDNPTVSIRVSRETYDRLNAMREQNDISLGDILRVSLEVQEPATRTANIRGYKLGYAEAEELYRVEFRCIVCNGRLAIDDDASKKAAAEYMRQGGWSHGSCLR